MTVSRLKRVCYRIRWRRVPRCLQQYVQPPTRPLSGLAQDVGRLQVPYHPRACMDSPATPANRTGACVQRSRPHIRSNRSRDTYRTGRHHAYARAGLGRYAPEKPWLVLWLHLSREHRCLPHLSTNSMHGGESTRCSIVLFEVQAPYRQPAASSSALAVISRRHCSAGTTAAQRPWLGGGLKPTAAAEQAQLRTRCEDHHPATPVAEPGCLEATPCVRPPLVHHKLRQRRRGRTGGPGPNALNSGGLTRA